MLHIAVDLQGADAPAQDLLPGALDFARVHADTHLTLFGAQDALYPALWEAEVENVALVHAPQTVKNTDNPLRVLTEKPESSLARALAFCKEGGAQALVSCGPTGALFTGGLLRLGRIPGATPTLLCELHKRDGRPFCVADCGANVDCRPEKLADFARMGRAYLQSLGVANPTFALLSNGAEEGKGNALTKAATPFLAQMEGFLGNVEGTEVPVCPADVIVCEGFAGNVLLKTLEGGAKAALWGVEQAAANLPETERAHLLSCTAAVRREYDYQSKGGAVLAGLRIPVVKGHGAATAETVCSILRIARAAVLGDLTGRVRATFAAGT